MGAHAGQWWAPTTDVERSFTALSEPNTRRATPKGWHHHVIIGMSGEVLAEYDLELFNPMGFIWARPDLEPEEMKPSDVALFKDVAPPPHWWAVSLGRARKKGGSGPKWFTDRYREWIVTGYAGEEL